MKNTLEHITFSRNEKCSHMCAMFLSRKPTRNKAFNTFIFLGGCPHLHSLPSMHQNSRLPERKQMLSINILVCANKVQRTTLISFKNDRNTQTPAKGQPCKQTFQRIAVGPALLTLFCRDHPLLLSEASLQKNYDQ